MTNSTPYDTIVISKEKEVIKMDEKTRWIAILYKQNIELMSEVQRLRNENEELKAELRRPERMTPSENAAYWGIFG